MPAHASEFEPYLSDWLEMFTTRPATLQMPVEALRLPLMMAACRVGCISALCQLAEKPSEDEAFKEFLRIDPRIVGEEVEEKLKRGLAPDAEWDGPRPQREP